MAEEDANTRGEEFVQDEFGVIVLPKKSRRRSCSRKESKTHPSGRVAFYSQ